MTNKSKYKKIFFIAVFLWNMATLALAQPDTIYSPYHKPVNWGGGLSEGDFNNDGYNDLVVLASGYQSNNDGYSGIINVYYGNKNGLTATPGFSATPEISSYIPGLNYVTTGDFNCDGFDDLAVSNVYFDEPQLDRGYVQVFTGSKTGLERKNFMIKVGDNAYGSFGSNLSVTDFNNDGKDDLVVESRFDNLLEGRIYIYTGKEDFNLENPDYKLRVENSLSLYYLFNDDINNDGKLDIIARSNNNWNANLTLIYFFYGGENAYNMPEKEFEFGEFRALFPIIDLETNSKYIVGYQANSVDNFTLKLFFPDGNGILTELQVVNSFFLPLNQYLFLTFSKSKASKFDIYSIKGGSFVKIKTGEFLNNDSLITSPEIFRLTQYSKQSLVFPIFRNGREFITFIDIGEY